MPLCSLVSPFTGSSFAANCSSLSHTLPSVLEATLLIVDSGKSQRGQRWLNVEHSLVQNHSAHSVCQKGRESVVAGARAYSVTRTFTFLL